MKLDPLLDIRDSHLEWWYVSHSLSPELHLLPALADDPALYERVVDGPGWLTATALCGLTREWWPPGVMARIGERRCARCSRAVGLKPGRGTPLNEGAE